MQILRMDGSPAMKTDAGMQLIIMNIKKNDVNRWKDRHGDGYRLGLDNNEYKIKNAIKMNSWMARDGDGCWQVLNNNEYKIKNLNTMDI